MNVAIIPAKGHSRRLPRKNSREFFGKPMFAHSVDTARASGLFDMIAVSTDDEYIASIAARMGCLVIARPPALAEHDGNPDCGTQEVARHALTMLERKGYKADYACCIYATAPLMRPWDLIEGYAMLRGPGHPPFVYAVGEDGKDAGQWYWGQAQAFIQRVGLDIPITGRLTLLKERVCDINTIEDWYRVIQLYRNLRRSEACNETPNDSGPGNSATSTPSATPRLSKTP